ncbi:3-hydroxyisobutyryl- mitochondrial-like [Brachionus plicatilis]|uniref:3-hydroxyisobutyryl-CoA hydrolase, mitochondrial n=1 Tax=Brachionus plicatilis TaxID=10195 RepID=A0A3M7P2E3_BRAPC|nr:3-hydroxyisobutyryl- mitochondrial-like [Brachionus plicatilis]
MTSSVSNEVLFNRINQVALITLNRPKQLNSLNLSMAKQMYAYLEDVENDDSIKAVVVKGAGESAFCAGGDVKSIRELCIQGQQDKAMEFFRQEYKLDFKIANFSKPYVALINGVTMGGGVGLSVHGRFRVATEKTLFAMPETAIGFIPDVGGSYFLPRLEGNIGLYLALTGNRLKGEDVKRTGIATHFIRMSNLNNLEQKIFESNNLSYENIDEILEEVCEKVPGEYDSKKISQIFQLNKTIEEMISELEADDSEWSRQQLKLLSKMSPTSLKITLKQLQLGKNMNLKEAFELEHQLCLRFTSFNSDFLEGVRCVLVDKGDKPKWNPSSIKEIDEKTVNWYFDPLPNDRNINLLSSSKL